MTPQAMEWARQHDWFIAALPREGKAWAVVVRDWEQDANGDYQPINRTFTDYYKLRVWAGY